MAAVTTSIMAGIGLPRWIALAIPVAVGLILWFLVPPSAGPGGFAAEGYTNDGAQAWHLFAIFVATIVAIILKPLLMVAPCMVSMALITTTRILGIADTLSGFANTTIWLIVMAFSISRRVIKTGLGTRIALLFVSKLGRRPLGLAYGMSLTDLVLTCRRSPKGRRAQPRQPPGSRAPVGSHAASGS